MKTSALLALLAAIIVIGGSIGLQAQPAAGVDYVPGQVLVLVKESNLGDKEIENILRGLSPVKIISIEKLHKYDLVKSVEPHGKRLLTLYFDEKINPNYVANRITKHPLVLIAEPNYIGYGVLLPSDPMFPQQWGLHNTGQNGGTPDADIDAPEAWDIGAGNENIIIAVIDTGADLDHQDLVDKLLPSWDAVQNDFVPEDDHGHGTRVTGVVGASTNNGLGIASACPDCMILPVRAGYNDGQGARFETFPVLLAIEYAVDNHDIEGVPVNPNKANVIVMSFGGFSAGVLDIAIEDAYNRGAILVAAAGNDNTNQQTYPAAHPFVIAVAATDENDAKTYFSNYGDWVDVAAPGIRIATTDWNDGYVDASQGLSGTSLSAPFVSGTVGLMLSRNPNLNQEEVRQVLIDTADTTTGFNPPLGRINAYNALLAINRAPVLQPMGPRYVRVGNDVVITASAVDPDNDTINFLINDGRFNYTALPRQGDVQQGQFVWHTGYNDAGTYTFEVTASDFNSDDKENVTVVVYRGSGGKEKYVQYGGGTD